MKNLIVLILGLTMLTACGKQVGQDAGGITPPTVTPNPGAANPPSNPSIIYSGLLDFVNSAMEAKQNFSVAPIQTNNYVTIQQSWVTIVDVDPRNTGNADSIQVKLYRYSDRTMSTQCVLTRINNSCNVTNNSLNNNCYVDSRTNQSLNVDCQFYVPQGYTMVLVFPDPTNSRSNGSVRADIDIVK